MPSWLGNAGTGRPDSPATPGRPDARTPCQGGEVIAPASLSAHRCSPVLAGVRRGPFRLRPEQDTPPAGHPAGTVTAMRVLMLGGTEFVGRAVTVAALARGHEVTVFHRGQHEPPAPAVSLHGDRTEPERTRGARGRHVGRGRRHLVKHARPRSATRPGCSPGAPSGTSTCRAGRCTDTRRPSSADEGAPLVDGSPTRRARWPIRRPSAAASWPRSREFGAERALLARAGPDPRPVGEHRPAAVVAGPGRTRRRHARAGPARSGHPVHRLPRPRGVDPGRGARPGSSGPYNLVSPPGHATMGSLLDACVRVTGGRAAPRWTDPEADPRGRDRAVASAAGVGSAWRAARHDPRHGCREGARGRAALSARRGDGRRHLGLAALDRRDRAPAPGPSPGRPRPGDRGEGAGRR